MRLVGILGLRARHKLSNFYWVWRSMCLEGVVSEDRCEVVEEPLKKMWRNTECYTELEHKNVMVEQRGCGEGIDFSRRRYFQYATAEAGRVIKVLLEDCPGFDTKAALDGLDLSLTVLLVREVLLSILKLMDHMNKTRCAKLGYKFFVWSGTRGKYRHTADGYHMMMKILAESDELRAMWRLVDEMTEKGLCVSARTFNIVICACGEAGLAKEVVERFMKSQSFNFRPFKSSFNAIIHSLLAVQHYRLIEWVHEQMLLEGLRPDTLTYNILLCAKCRLGKMDQFHELLSEMCRDGHSPDLHTYNLLLHVLGKKKKLRAAFDLLKFMREAGIQPSVLHYTTLIDGFSRAGNLDACQFFFVEIRGNGYALDVVCYTVMITCLVSAFQIEQAQALFDEMIPNGLLPNVYTYNTMIRGLCMVKRFDKAISILKEMKSRGCNPNFNVYNTLVGNLQNAGQFSKVNDVIKLMENNRQYPRHATKIMTCRRSVTTN